MIAYSYRRFSSKAQAKGDSIRRQIELAEKYCLKHRLRLSGKTFEDLGVSAWNGSNSAEDAGLGLFLQACENGVVESDAVLLVENLDRLSRERIKKAMRQLMDITDYVDVITLVDGRRYTKDMDITDFIIAGATMQRANEESEIKSKRVSAAWEAKRRDPKGSKKTRKCPTWLDVTEDSMSFVLNDRVEIVQKAFELSSQGLGNLKVANQLNSLGFKTDRNKDWSPASVSHLLRSRMVLGEYQPKKTQDGQLVNVGCIVADYYPRVIDLDLFNKVQLCIAERSKKIRMGATRSHRNLIRDNGKCMCGGTLFITSKRQGVPYFQCQNGVNKGCIHGLFRFDVFLQFIREQIIRPLYFNYWVTEQGSELENKRNSLLVDVADKQKRLDTLLEMDILNPSIQSKISDLGIAIQDLKAEVGTLDTEIARMKISGNKRQSVDSMFRMIDVAGGLGCTVEEIASRVELSRILSRFKFQLGNVDRCSIVSIEHFDKRTDREIKQIFKSLRIPSRAMKKSKQIWTLTSCKM
ncbi:recombinase family protein [Vibrio apostichopi]|uniref:recombinase family protein n=1 Tax=Vibrio apostichopi TaxID=3035453 RepID=UPI002572C878|nr:recombinase family protein [Vibrio sp. FE10]